MGSWYHTRPSTSRGLPRGLLQIEDRSTQEADPGGPNGRAEHPAGITVWTVGHGTRPTEDLVAVLRQAGVERVVDVRRFPGSRRNPQYSMKRMAADLRAAGIDYAWCGDALGGRRSVEPANRHDAWRNPAFRAYAGQMETRAFRDALHRLESAVRSGVRVAILCAETTWWRCHRRMIADALVLDGFTVRHLMDRAPGSLHPLHSAAHLDEGGRVIYEVAAG